MLFSAQHFGHTSDGQEIISYEIGIPQGIKARILNYGGIITHLFVPDNQGKEVDVVLGFDTWEGYAKGHPNFGAVVGRYANRIAKGQFEIDGQSYQVSVNHGKHCLHGGYQCFADRIWKVEKWETDSEIGLKMSYLSIDGEEGFPGNLSLEMNYSLILDNELKINYKAQTDKATPINLTNHSYFNLAGTGEIHEHHLRLFAEAYTETDAELIPTGRLLSVEGTPLDFRDKKAIGPQIRAQKGGFDHNLVLSNPDQSLRLAAELSLSDGSRKMETWTTEPALQLFTIGLGDPIQGKQLYTGFPAVCLEAQHYPDSPNHTHFPNTILRPYETYRQLTVYRFYTADSINRKGIV
jgi:aldose 1-epimerase